MTYAICGTGVRRYAKFLERVSAIRSQLGNRAALSPRQDSSMELRRLSRRGLGRQRARRVARPSVFAANCWLAEILLSRLYAACTRQGLGTACRRTSSSKHRLDGGRGGRPVLGLNELVKHPRLSLGCRNTSRHDGLSRNGFVGEYGEAASASIAAMMSSTRNVTWWTPPPPGRPKNRSKKVLPASGFMSSTR